MRETLANRMLFAAATLLAVGAACDESRSSTPRASQTTSATESEGASEGQTGSGERIGSTDSGLSFFRPTVLLESGGLRLERQRWSWRDETGLAWRVRVTHPTRPSILPAREKLARLAALTPSDDGPWAAINGGFYRRTDQGVPVPLGVVVADGETIAEMGTGGGSGIFQMTSDGPAIIHRSEWQPGPAEALQSVDRLADEGASLVESRNPERTARSAVALGENFLWLVALAGDGSISRTDQGARLTRTSGHGLPLHVFADYLLASTEVSEALNLDGGVSTQLRVKTPGGAFRLRGPRPVINALLIRPLDERSSK